jgi:peptide/nickel transport system permease protein
MVRYILKRLAIAIPTLIGITIVTFCIIQLAPGDPADRTEERGDAMTHAGEVSPEIIERTRRLYGLDKPLFLNFDVWTDDDPDHGAAGFWEKCAATFTEAQYPIWLGRIVTWDFGTSYHDHRPVTTRVWEGLRVTLLFQAAAILLIYLIAVPLGVLSAVKRGTLLDSALSTALFLLYSLPNFWVATLLIVFLAGGEFLDLFPPEGLNSYGAGSFGPVEWFFDRLWHMILPVLCLTYGGLASLSRYTRSGMLEVIRQDYIQTARAKGLSEWKVIGKHAFRNGMIPIVTLLANIFPALIGGSVIVESIFNIPGMGLLLYSSFLSRDYPVIMAISFFSAALVLLGMILSDVLYRVVDPRISIEGSHE